LEVTTSTEKNDDLKKVNGVVAWDGANDKGKKSFKGLALPRK
jgi:hypothetical protein